MNDIGKYQFYLKVIELIEKHQEDYRDMNGEEWYSLINKVLDCIYKELYQKPEYDFNKSSYSSTSSESVSENLESVSNS